MTSITLGEAVSLIIDNRGKTPKKLGGDWTATGHRVVSALNIKDNAVDGNEHHFISDQMYAKWMREPLRAGDVLLTSEAPLGEVAYIPRDVDWAVGQRLFALRPDRNILDGRFLFYLLQNGAARHDMLSRATGTTVTGIRQSELVKVELDLPPLERQREISASLGVLDDKIQSNQRVIALLEKILALEFTRVVRSEPKSRVPLADLTSLTKGVSYKSADLQQSSTALVTLKSFNRNGGYKSEGLKPYTGPHKAAQIIEPGEIVVAQTDLTQGAEVIGRAVRVPPSSKAETLVASLDLVIVRPNPGVTQEYLLGVLTDDAFRQHCRSHTSGTTVLHLASDAIPTYSAPVVSTNGQARFSSIARPMIERRDAVEEESARLRALRDALMPELLSGEWCLGSIAEAVA